METNSLLIEFRGLLLYCTFRYSPEQKQSYDTPPFAAEIDLKKVELVTDKSNIIDLLSDETIEELENGLIKRYEGNN